MEKRFLTTVEKQIAAILSSQVVFLPGSYDKRFCKFLALDVEYTTKQIAFLHKLSYKYRRQIKDYIIIKTKLELQPCF